MITVDDIIERARPMIERLARDVAARAIEQAVAQLEHDLEALFCERVERGCAFVARTYFAERFYSGSGATALEAVAWCVDDVVRRAVRGESHRMALPSGARPGDFVEAA